MLESLDFKYISKRQTIRLFLSVKYIQNLLNRIMRWMYDLFIYLSI